MPCACEYVFWSQHWTQYTTKQPTVQCYLLPPLPLASNFKYISIVMLHILHILLLLLMILVVELIKNVIDCWSSNVRSVEVTIHFSLSLSHSLTLYINISLSLDYCNFFYQHTTSPPSLTFIRLLTLIWSNWFKHCWHIYLFIAISI